MSLYDGLGVDTGPSKKDNTANDKKSDVSGWSAGIKMMQSHLRMKKAALTEAQRKMKQPSLPPVVDLKKMPGPGPGPGPGSGPGPVPGPGSRSGGDEDPTPGPTEESSRYKSSPVPPKSRPPPSAPRPTPVYSSSSQLGSDGENEYDPAYPNEYEKVAKKLRERRERERDEQERREREESRRRRRERERERDRERDRERERERRDRDRDRDREREPQGFSRRPPSDDEDDDRDRERRRNVANRAAIAPPSSLINEDSQVKDDEFAAPLPPQRERPYADLMRKKKRDDEDDDDDDDDPEGARTPPRGAEFPPPAEPSTFAKPSLPKTNFQAPVGLGADSVAAKIMAKYGFKEGAGLGKSEQGISTALQVEKTSRRGGKIINKDKEIQEQVVMPPPSMPPPSIAKSGPPPITNVLRNPTKILLLTNMVGPGEVDDDLQPETAEECTKYGDVVKVLIYEDPSKTPDEAVRIFVEFTRVEAAVKAVVDLNGRFFGGRVVKASFYEPVKFEKFDLSS